MAFQIIKGGYYPVECVADKLEVGVYLMKEDYNKRCAFAKPLFKEFSLPERIYGHSEAFVDRIITAIKDTPQNTGMLFYGYQGTGKTITGKVISNMLQVPVLLIQERISMEFLTDFISSLDQEFVIFVDEYEKVYNRAPNELLTILDGVFSCKSKFTFIATANQPNVSPFMYNRPSRIRYVREFGFLTKELIYEIVDDKLQRRALINEVTAFLTTKPQMTIDVASSFITEVNIQKNLSVTECAEYFNFAREKKPEVPEPVEVESLYDDEDDD